MAPICAAVLLRKLNTFNIPILWQSVAKFGHNCVKKKKNKETCLSQQWRGISSHGQRCASNFYFVNKNRYSSVRPTLYVGWVTISCVFMGKVTTSIVEGYIFLFVCFVYSSCLCLKLLNTHLSTFNKDVQYT